MREIFKSVIPKIESVYDSLTALEKEIADFFIQNTDEELDVSAQAIAEHIHVSEASLTRFAKKCGYSGYREFIYDYQTNQIQKDQFQSESIKRVLFDYNEILNKTYSLIDAQQLERITNILTSAKRVYFYGKGSSGLAAMEMKIRFMRLGMVCEAITDDDVMRVNHAVLNEECAVIGISVSGKTDVVLRSVKQAAQKGATTLLFTKQAEIEGQSAIDEIVNVASMANLNYGNRISPQFPILVVIDLIYDYFMDRDRQTIGKIFDDTLDAFPKNREE